jgi:hypothetical protein
MITIPPLRSFLRPATMADSIKLNIAAMNEAATKTTAINGSAPVMINSDALKGSRVAALLLKAGPLPDVTSSNNLLQPLGALDASASQIADEIADGIKHEMALAIAQPDAALPADGFGQLARDLVATAKPEKAAAAKQRAAAQIAAPTAVQAAVFGSFAGKDAAAHADAAIKVSNIGVFYWLHHTFMLSLRAFLLHTLLIEAHV